MGTGDHLPPAPTKLAESLARGERPASTRSIQGVETGIPVFIGYGESPELEVRALVAHDTNVGGARYRLAESLRVFFENGGRRCYVVSLPGGEEPALQDFRAGLAAAARVGDADLMVLPDAALLRADEYGTLAREVLKDCATTRRFAILDQVEGADPGTSWLSWGAAYRIPVGKVAGLYAAADLQHGVWKAPAELPGNTLAREGEWKNAAVRRLAIMIERSIERGLRWVVLEPMKRQLFAQVRAMTEAFLLDLWRRGALAGGAAEAAFFVRCDETTMPPEDLDMGDFVIEVGIAPSKPEEFAVLRIVQRAAS